MAPGLPPTSDPHGTAGRLNGWKQIARHFGKGVRTIQRWEKEYDLPVHRLEAGAERADPVFAFVDELERWARAGGASRASGAAAPPRPRRWPTRRAGALLTLAGAVTVAASWLLLRAPAVGREPVRTGPPQACRVAGDALRVLDAEGRLVFEHRFGFELLPASLSEGAHAQLVDLDDDGRVEVLVAVPAIRREERRLYCFESDGRLRFAQQPGGDVRFGSVDYRPPWVAFGVWVTRSAVGRASVWASFVHGFLFPTRLQRLSPRGELLGEYWSDGYVLSVGEGRWRGRDAVLVGGVNNELKDAGLAIFDREVFGGSAPAVNPEYACGTCAAGGPREFVAFPSSCLLRRVGGIAGVVAASVTPGDQLEATVVAGHGRPGDLDGMEPVFARYTLGPDLAAVRLEVSPEFRALHDALAAAGRVDHAFGEQDEAALLRLRRFAGGRFVALPPRLDR